jgi:hypothetical protein
MHMRRIYVGAMVIGGSMLVGKSALAQCQRDTDCKGARVCLNGQCVDRPAAAPAPAPAPMPAPQPAYAPQPQPGYAPAPQPQPGYAPQPQPGYAPQPTAPPGAGAGAAAGVGVEAGAAAATSGVRLGQGMHLVLSADRLFGFHYWSASVTPKTAGGAPIPAGVTVEYNASGAQIAFLGGGASTGSSQMDTNPYAVPRLAFDAVLNGGFSVGGSLVVFTSAETEKQTVNGVEASVDGPTTTAIGFAPRAGYLAMFNDMIGIWPRLGFTYIMTSSKTKTGQNTANVVEVEDSYNFLSIDPEALLVITPVPHFGFTVGLQASVGVSGSATTKAAGVTSDESDVKLTNIGLTAGLLGYF